MTHPFDTSSSKKNPTPHWSLEKFNPLSNSYTSYILLPFPPHILETNQTTTWVRQPSSIHAFLHSYHSFTSIAALLVLPFSVSTLLSQAVITSSPQALDAIASRLRAIFQAASFPSSSPLSSLLNLSLLQTVFTSAFALPFTLTVLILAKASVIRTATRTRSSLLRLYVPLLRTHVFNFFLLLSANAAVFALLFLLFTAADSAGLSSRAPLLAVSSLGAVLYSLAIAKTVVTCNLAVVVSAAEGCGGYAAVLRACVLIRGRVGTALSLALTTNLAVAAAEALFQYRVVRPYRALSAYKFDVSVVSEAFTIAYVHSVLVVLDTVANCLFYKSCKSGCGENWEDGIGYHVELEPEDKCAV